MHASLRLLPAAAAATLVLALGVATSAARSLSTSSQTMRLTWGLVEFGLEPISAIRCPVTLEGSFHARTIAKVEGTLIGSITRAAVRAAECTNGTAAAFNGVETYNGAATSNTLPWHVTYKSFASSLPQISSVNLLMRGMRWGLRASEGICIGQYGTAEDNVVLTVRREASGGLTEVIPSASSNSIRLFRRDGGLACPERAQLSSHASTVMVLGTTTRITVTLI